MRRKMFFAASYALGLLLLGALAYVSNFGKVAGTLAGISIAWIAASVAIYAADWAIRGLKWQAVLKKLGCGIGLKDSVSLNLAGNLVNLAIPAKIGDLSRVYGLKKRHGVPYRKGLVSVGADRFFDLVGVLLLAAVSFVPLFFVLNIPPWLWWAMLSALAVVAAGFAFIAFSGRLKAVFGRWERVAGVIGFLGQMRSLRLVALLSALSLAVWAIECMITFWLMTSLGFSVPVWIVILAVMAGNITKTIPVTPGGLGVYELVVTSVLVLGGLPYDAAFSVAIVDHLLKNLFVLAAGLFSASHIGFGILKFGK